jgi:hypothetical protein
VWDLSVRGCTQRDIAQQLTISQAAVCKILQRLGARYDRELGDDIAQQRRRAHARLDHLYRESVRGYERSQEDDVRKIQRRLPGGTTSREMTEVQVRKRAGDPRFLREARESVLAVCALVARTAVASPAPSPTGPDLSRLSDRELELLAAVSKRLYGSKTDDGSADEEAA